MGSHGGTLPGDIFVHYVKQARGDLAAGLTMGLKHRHRADLVPFGTAAIPARPAHVFAHHPSDSGDADHVLRRPDDGSPATEAAPEHQVSCTR